MTPGAGPAAGSGASAAQVGATLPSPVDPSKAGWWNRPGETMSQFISRSPGAAAITFLAIVFASYKW